ncbi:MULTISPECIES: FecCD family ABC transporter permease [Brevibacillus]|jgi:ABC-type Fe3+-siderophore transport system, permease component|uniref:FecCD family ABC transporter permease n=1 Tax=Brevibacillus TaxID=55080 RepID=UPI000EDB17FC|nr:MULTISPECIES: iron ABC transporter permease [Brevibacillus]UED67322.1 iron ABC transporter permease [Brevibacillus sp. HD3.3A]WDV93582.1 iron ABC transporter permease [Brevibacillus parabrevis]HBZ78943.1 iron ABC transporter permease [Brevibacillus sp.]
MKRRPTWKNATIVSSLAVAALILAVFCLSLGSVSIPIRDVVLSLVGMNGEGSDLIITQFRLPRIVAALLIGAALAVSGSLLQGVIRNPLASPDLLGVTGGASVAVVAFMTAFTSYSIHYVPIIAIAGAFAAASVNYSFAWKKGVTPSRLVLIGIGISTAMSALTMFLLLSGPAYLAAQVLNWMTGSLYGTNWSYIKAIWPWIVALIPLSLLYAKELDIQALGEETAIGLGSRLQMSRMVAMLLSVALAGVAVGIAGTISFIGLLAPHMARKLVGNRYGIVIPTAALIGAIVLLLADLAGRMLFLPLDIPAGVFTAGVGAPFFLYLLFRRKRPGA